VCLTARHLEENGISTVIIGSALDIVTRCGAPRYLFTDLPLGNPCGVPYDTEMQKDILHRALHLFESTTEAGAVETAPHQWPAGQDWRATYARVS